MLNQGLLKPIKPSTFTISIKIKQETHELSKRVEKIKNSQENLIVPGKPE